MVTSLMRRFWSDKSGATSIEYGMIAVLISIVMLVALTSISGNVAIMYETLADSF